MTHTATYTAPPVEVPPAPTQADHDAKVIRRIKAVSAVLLLVLGGVSFTAGIPGLLAAGQWAQLGELAWLLPILIDGGIVFSALAAMAWRAETGGRAGVLAWTMVAALTITSVAAQVTHVLGAHGGALAPESAVGAGVASLFPLVVLASMRQFELLRFGNLVEREAVRAAKASGRKAPARAAKPAARTADTASTRPAPRAASRPKASGPVAPETRDAAVKRVLAGEPLRPVARELEIPRSTLQKWVQQAA